MTTLLSLVCALAIGTSAYAEPGMVEVEEQSENSQQNVHIIQPGDTLWDIANTYYQTPDQWPSLWSFNESITNPHWIYPGNRIVFSLGSDLDLPQVDLVDNNDNYIVPDNSFEKTSGACGPDITFDFKQDLGTFTVNAFMKHPEMVDVLGVVTNSPRNRSMLTDLDLIYIKVKNKEEYKCGDVLTVFRKLKDKVRHPEAGFFTESNYGSIYGIMGEIVVVHTPEVGDYITAEIRESWGEVMRGDLVGPRMDVIIQNEVEVPEGSTQGTIIALMSNEHELNTNRHILFIDKGSRDNIKSGDTFYVVRRKDAYIRNNKNDALLPATVIGRVMVVDVEEDSSSVIITDSKESIGVGDQISQNVD